MGEVVATVKLMPESPDVDLEQMKIDAQNVVSEDAELHKIDEEPIAFGLVALNVMFIIDDGEGGTEIVEEKLAKLPNVNSVEVLDVRRLM
ncbi:MAG: elongation factor 1-beta [Methanobrevibacter arboriphilus]|mgnify:CR=1 FL=1|jgi:elongation factor 1-beta|uniref:Elongation factor 1-beta n=3 Tax=Methanobrevibacter arboriphilus TaxID=39441 RepID=A0A1V6N4M2_METAZ|nr:elongation factor 1-beta [Methanobrevibacter arboriphilus]MBF4467839.1 elongation factor 1-beta [Methanobrevibacter arboriphilus]MCC7562568.1 elongation factor 1-beta [Methanobrevibacter arboriphilus]OQD59660.1 translation elongation factor 1B [Methanobrevibacter arboriphilus JCM 13429 = DSM 1125]BBL61854.1 effector protein [Methanobrevibacter arboriphilus]GLI10966.1 effector protein [Methanobrevibacter arboriphilus]